MSRIGKAPIPLPDGVEFDYDNAVVTVKGPKGELTQRVPRELLVEVAGGALLQEGKVILVMDGYLEE